MCHSTSFRLVVVVVGSACLAVQSTTAVADPPSVVRKGLIAGFGIGAGSMSCESDQDICNNTLDQSGGIDGHIGKMLNSRLAVQVELWGMFYSEDRVTIQHWINTVGAQYWLAPRLWIKGGIGGAHVRASYKGPLLSVSDRSDTVLGVMGAVGYEVVVGKRFTIDAQLRGGTGFYKDDQVRARNAAVSVGFNWY